MIIYVGLRASYKFGFGSFERSYSGTKRGRQQNIPVKLSKHIKFGAHISEIFLVNSEITFLEEVVLVFDMSFVGISQANYNWYINNYYYNSVTWPQRGRVTVELVSPSGTISELLPRRRADIFPGTYDYWPLSSTHFWGEDPKGIWTIVIQSYNYETLSVQVPSVTLYGLSQVPSESPRGSGFGDSEKPDSDVFGAATSTEFGVN